MKWSDIRMSTPRQYPIGIGVARGLAETKGCCGYHDHRYGIGSVDYYQGQRVGVRTEVICRITMLPCPAANLEYLVELFGRLNRRI